MTLQHKATRGISRTFPGTGDSFHLTLLLLCCLFLLSASPGRTQAKQSPCFQLSTLESLPQIDNDWFTMTSRGEILFSSEGWIYYCASPAAAPVNTRTQGEKPHFSHEYGLFYLKKDTLWTRNWKAPGQDSGRDAPPPRQLIRGVQFRDLTMMPEGDLLLLDREGLLQRLPSPPDRVSESDLSPLAGIYGSLLIPDTQGRFITLDAADSPRALKESSRGFKTMRRSGQWGLPRTFEQPAGMAVVLPWAMGRHAACLQAGTGNLALYDQTLDRLFTSRELVSLGISHLPERAGRILWDSRRPALVICSSGKLSVLLYRGPLSFSRNSLEKLATTAPLTEKIKPRGADVMAYSSVPGQGYRMLSPQELSGQEGVSASGTRAPESMDSSTGRGRGRNWSFPSEHALMAFGGTVIPIYGIHRLGRVLYDSWRRFRLSGGISRKTPQEGRKRHEKHPR